MNFLTFDGEMLTPKFISVLYWLMLVGVAVVGLGVMFSGSGWAVFLTIIAGLILMVVGAIWVRISCELMVVFFKMNEALQELRKNKALQ